MSEHDNHTPNTDELRDRLLDMALRERLGDKSPPDLSARILGDYEMVTTQPNTEPSANTSRTRWYLLAIAATLLVGAVPLAMNRSVEDQFGEVANFQEINDGANKVKLLESATSLSEAGPVDKKATTGTDFQLAKPVSASDRHSVSESQALDRYSRSVDVYPSANVWEELSSTRKLRLPVQSSQPNPIDEDLPVDAMGSESLARPLGDLGYGVAPASPSPRNRFAGGGRGGRGGRGGQAGERGEAEALLVRDLVIPPQRRAGLAFKQVVEEPKLNELGNGPDSGGDQYDRIHENPFYEAVGERAVSTFSIDVDRASYANVRQFLMQSSRMPPPDAVRIEELVNYFDYAYTPPESENGEPFAAHVEVAGCPWAPEHRLVRIGIKGRELDADKRPQSNLVFLLDVSGSMNHANKLPLVVEGMKALTRQLGENDRVAIVVYASSEGLVLPSTPGTEQEVILGSLDQLRAGGSTAGGAGIQLAYQIAEDNFIEGGVNRVILCTDGDFNVGTTSSAELERMVEQKAKDTRVFLSVLGFGRGNLNDAMMETISNRGNGNYHYVDSRNESRRVLVEEMTGMLVTIAKDVKIQVFFNPAQVGGYRLIGYENRMLRTQDFNDDTKDAGEIGAGHTVTALYEIVPAGEKVDAPSVDESPYVTTSAPTADIDRSGELLTLRMRYKQPDGDTSTLREWPVTDAGNAFSAASGDFKFASAVASFGMLLRDSQHRGNATWDAVAEIAGEGVGDDPHGRRAEFLTLVERAKELNGE